MAVRGREQQDDKVELPLDGRVDLRAGEALVRKDRSERGELDAAALPCPKLLKASVNAICAVGVSVATVPLIQRRPECRFKRNGQGLQLCMFPGLSRHPHGFQ